MREQDQPDGVAHLGEQRDLALERRVGEQLVDRLDLLAAGGLGVVGDAGEAALPGQRVRRGPGRTRRSCRLSSRLAALGMLALSSFCTQPRRISRATIQSVLHHDVAAGVLAGLQLRLDLGEELVVVVVVLGVVDLDAGLLRERVERRVLLGLVVDVDVLGPVGPVDDLLGVGACPSARLVAGAAFVCRARWCRRRPAPAATPRRPRAVQQRAAGEQCRARERPTAGRESVVGSWAWVLPDAASGTVLSVSSCEDGAVPGLAGHPGDVGHDVLDAACTPRASRRYMSLPKPDALTPPCGISLMIGMWSLTQTQPGLDLAGGALRPGRRPGSTRRRPARTACRWPARCASSSVSKGSDDEHGPEDLVLHRSSRSWSTSATSVGS